MFEIELIKPEKAVEIVNLAVDELEKGITKSNRNLYIAKDGDKYIAIDNTNGDCWTEEFKSLYVANCWLMDTMDTEEAYKVDAAITRVAEFVKQHDWYKDYPMEKCREMAEYQIIKLRDSQKRKGAK